MPRARGSEHLIVEVDALAGRIGGGGGLDRRQPEQQPVELPAQHATYGQVGARRSAERQEESGGCEATGQSATERVAAHASAAAISAGPRRKPIPRTVFEHARPSPPLELAPEIGHVHVDQSGARVEVDAPHALEQILARDDLSRPRDQGLHEPVLGRRQVEPRAAPPRLVAQPVELDVAAAQHGRPRVRAPAVQRAQSGEQLFEIERLRQVVVRARVQPAHHVPPRIPRREEQNRRAVPGGAQLRGHLESRAAGQHHVQHDRVIAAARHALDCLLAGGHHVHAVALLAQTAAQERRDSRLVLYHQDPHLGISAAAAVVPHLPGGEACAPHATRAGAARS